MSWFARPRCSYCGWNSWYNRKGQQRGQQWGAGYKGKDYANGTSAEVPEAAIAELKKQIAKA
ncbi:MAG TPA: hypothetical protein EYQ27_14120, partial [Gemmatimonadetes bacterium]|nr:hypothetical protein [Gemmatimonadota bacterium]